jgi:hypothetical protein
MNLLIRMVILESSTMLVSELNDAALYGEEIKILLINLSE